MKDGRQDSLETLLGSACTDLNKTTYNYAQFVIERFDSDAQNNFVSNVVRIYTGNMTAKMTDEGFELFLDQVRDFRRAARALL